MQTRQKGLRKTAFIDDSKTLPQSARGLATERFLDVVVTVVTPTVRPATFECVSEKSVRGAEVGERRSMQWPRRGSGTGP